MILMQVQLTVKTDNIEAFKTATLANAKETILEPGNIRFELLEDQSNPTKFVLLEIYENEDSMTKHFASGHFKAWQQTVAEFFSEPSVGSQYNLLFPINETKR